MSRVSVRTVGFPAYVTVGLRFGPCDMPWDYVMSRGIMQALNAGALYVRPVRVGKGQGHQTKHKAHKSNNGNSSIKRADEPSRNG